MNLSKSRDFFNPADVDGKINIIGCGSVGSTVAENLARCGILQMTLWDFDIVEPKNIANQLFRQKDIGALKTESLKNILLDINPDLDIELKSKGWQGEMVSGFVFLCVDSIELRKAIVQKVFNSPYIRAVFDFRTMLESAQHYAADWQNKDQKNNILASMQFTHEEASEEVPVSACGVVLGVATTVRIISALGVNNFICFVKNRELKKFVLADCFNMALDAF